MNQKLNLTDRGYINGNLIYAAHLESYRALHNGRRRFYLVSKWIGVFILVTGLALNVPAVAVIGGAVAWWAAGKRRE